MTRPIRILAICGSLQARSGNRDLLQAAVAAAPAGVEVAIFEALRELPHFDPDLEPPGAAPPPPVAAWRAAIAASDALLIACPEYGHSLPGCLKNAIDWAASAAHPRGARGFAWFVPPAAARAHAAPERHWRPWQ